MGELTDILVMAGDPSASWPHPDSVEAVTKSWKICIKISDYEKFEIAIADVQQTPRLYFVCMVN